MTKLGSENFPLRIAVVGSGPSGFYAAEALLQSSLFAYVDVIESLPVPYGLVRYGVAPDHPKLKEVTQVFARIATHERFNFFGNVRLGVDLTVDELAACYHAVVIATGASQDRALGIDGEALSGVHSATEFVGWYNGHPSCAHLQFDLSGESAVIVGHGNVALDVCRILATPVDQLRRTDIADHAIEALSRSRIREIHVVGRRGPAQARFTSKELREFGQLQDCSTVVDPAELELTAACKAELAHPLSDGAVKNLQLLLAYAATSSDAQRRVHLRFRLAPFALRGEGRVSAFELQRTRLVGEAFSQEAEVTDERVLLKADIVFRSVGYKSEPIAGFPFDTRRGTIPHADGRVVGDAALKLPSYVTGWIKRGPSGVIGSNRADSQATVATMLADVDSWPQVQVGGSMDLLRLLQNKCVRVTGWTDWLRIDEKERHRGASEGRPRSKIVSVKEMLEAAG